MLMEALAAEQGEDFRGDGAHARLIDWATEEVELSRADQEFLQSLRQYRNRVQYEGFQVDTDWLSRNRDPIERLSMNWTQQTMTPYKNSVQNRVYARP